MDKYTCIIIEDEPLALEKTKDFVSKVPFLNLSATFDNALDGLAYLNSNQVDLLFLDINMDELSGIELLEKIMINDILYIEGMRDYLRIHTTTKKVMTLQNFAELEQLIPGHLVCRVHKSYMVAINKIESVERNRIKIADQLIPVSETYKETFLQLISSKP